MTNKLRTTKLSQNRTISRVGQLKKHTLQDSSEMSVRVNDRFLLVPVGDWIFTDRDTIEAMSKWRSAHMGAFFKRFESSVESMRNYLFTHAVGESNRLLFLAKQGAVFVGHLGLSNIEGRSAELDNVLKSPDWLESDDSSSMRECLRILMQWANSNLSIDNFCLNVLSSNVRAINLYEKLGFSISQRVPVKPDPNCAWGSLIDDLENSEKNNSLYRLKMTLVFTDRRR